MTTCGKCNRILAGPHHLDSDGRCVYCPKKDDPPTSAVSTEDRS